MRSFKEQVDIDSRNVFLNPKEFADLCTLEGKEINCILDTNGVGHREYNRGSSFNDNLYDYAITIIYNFIDYTASFAYGDEVVFDGILYHCAGYSKDDGIVTLKLTLTGEK